MLDHWPVTMTEIRHVNRLALAKQLPKPSIHSSHIEDGYNITRTDAPKDLGGRLRLNCARTTPELPIGYQSPFLIYCPLLQHTMWSGNLAPNDSDL